MLNLPTLASLLLLAAPAAVYADPCVSFDVNFNLLAFGFNGKDYNAGPQDSWTSGEPYLLSLYFYTRRAGVTIAAAKKLAALDGMACPSMHSGSTCILYSLRVARLGPRLRWTA